MANHLSVVFSKSDKIDDHLFGKAIRWADQNPNDLVYWFRRKSLAKIPNVDLEWSSKVSALKRVIFQYNEKNLTGACMYTALGEETFDDVAAIIISISADVKVAHFGGLLASLAHFCTQNLARAVVCVENWKEKESATVKYQLEAVRPSDSCDVWEKGPTKYDSQELEFQNAELEENIVKREKRKTSEPEKGPVAHLEKLKLISTMYSNNIFEFNSCETGLCKLKTGELT